MFVKVFAGRGVASNFHDSQLRERPGVEVGGPRRSCGYVDISRPDEHGRADKDSEINSPDKANMHTHVSVNTGAIETDVDTERRRGPGRVLGLTVEAHLVKKDKEWSELINDHIGAYPPFHRSMGDSR